MRTGTLLQNLALLIGLEVLPAVVQFPWLSMFLSVAHQLRLAGTSGSHLVQAPAHAGPPRAVVQDCPDGF